MTAQMTIIGMGKIGTSFGLALAEHTNQITRVGHDRKPEVAKEAAKKGAVDKTEFNLHSAVEGADIVLLAVPVDEVKTMLELIAEDLKEGAVVIDTSPVMVGVADWARSLIPKGRYFVSMSPTFNAEYIHETVSGIDASHADLFKNSMMVITSPPNMDADAIKLAADLCTLVGSSPFFADPYEFDGLSAASRMLPKLAAAALVNATATQAGWTEARKIAAYEYFAITEPILHLDETKVLGQASMLNRENTMRVIDDLIVSLEDIREALESKDEEKLSQLIGNALEKRELWFSQRRSANWEKRADAPKVPSAGENMRRMLTGSLFDRKKK